MNRYEKDGWVCDILVNVTFSSPTVRIFVSNLGTMTVHDVPAEMAKWMAEKLEAASLRTEEMAPK